MLLLVRVNIKQKKHQEQDIIIKKQLYIVI